MERLNSLKKKKKSYDTLTSHHQIQTGPLFVGPCSNDVAFTDQTLLEFCQYQIPERQPVQLGDGSAHTAQQYECSIQSYSLKT